MVEAQPFPWRSVLLAPLTSAPAAAVASLGSSDAGLLSDLGWGFFFGVLIGVPVSYVGMIVFGVPTYLALRKLRLLRLWIFSTVGALVPLLMLVGSAPLRTTLMAVAAGLAVGASAFLLLPDVSLPGATKGVGSDV